MNKQTADYYRNTIQRIQGETTGNGVYQLCEIVEHLVTESARDGGD